MKSTFILVVLAMSFVAATALGQASPPAPPGVPFMRDWNPPAALMSDWWNDPEVANELRLTDAQKRQLEQVSTNLKLTLIDAGASGLKSYVRLQSLLDADQFDRAAYNQQLDAASATAANLVRDLGQMAMNIRTILTPEQWHKLEAMKAAGRVRARAQDGGRQHRRSEPPSSLRTPQ